METKNICGKIPLELHNRIREELEGTETTIPQFLTRVITEYFEKKGEDKMAARTLAVQVSEELFERFKKRYEKEKACRAGRFSQKDYLIEIITRALDEADGQDAEEGEPDGEEDAQTTPEPEEQDMEREPEETGEEAEELETA